MAMDWSKTWLARKQHRKSMCYRYVVLFILLFTIGKAGAEKASFRFRGLTLYTTMQEVTSIYPAAGSGAINGLFRISDPSGHVAAIAIYPARNFIKFRSSTSCRAVFDEIYKSYRGPHMIQRYQEARTKIHRRVWISGNERMALRCYYRDGQKLAESVEFYHYP